VRGVPNKRMPILAEKQGEPGGSTGRGRHRGPSLRLSPQQVAIIKAEAQRQLGTEARVILFGSRTDDSARGGDIDLLVLTSSPVENRALAAIRFAAALQQRLGDQRIDVLVVTPDTPLQPIHRTAMGNGVPL
jgi:predicted nucleotidyltransferase